MSGFQGPESGKMGLLFQGPFSVGQEHTLGLSGLALQPQGEGCAGLMVSEKQLSNGKRAQVSVVAGTAQVWHLLNCCIESFTPVG